MPTIPSDTPNSPVSHSDVFPYVTAPGGPAGPYPTAAISTAPAVYDPLAQSFLLPSAAQVMAVDLWFTAKGTGTQAVMVQVREANQGLPTPVVLAQSHLAPDAITLNAWNRFSFAPITLIANREYVLVVAATDAVSAVAVATLGEYDGSAGQWVTTQPYQIGVLLSSSNNLSWTPHQTTDLSFRLYATPYPSEPDTLPTRILALDPIDVVDADQLIVLATVERPASNCDVSFHITAGSQTYVVVENQILTLAERFTGTLTWTAHLVGSQYASPVLHQDIQLVAGKRLTTSNYISRALDTKVGPLMLSVDLDCYIDALLPGGATVAATAQLGAAWEPLILLASEELGEGWVELHYQLEDITETQTRVQLVINGTAVQRPRLKNLRVALT